MAKKKKEEVKLIEDAVFDSVEKAQREVKFAKINLIRTLIGAAFAVLSTILLLIALFGKDSNFYMYAALPAIPAYLIGGGIGKAVKAAWKITKIGWFLIPVFPADVLLAIAFFILSLFVFFYLPIIFVGLNYVEHKRAYNAAQAYLAQFAPNMAVQATTENQP
ncbi:hypothetical protein [uncultured Ruminococcus sp.]|uniref:hypothetical protein n=1 Tax=uncultured Ruminococcus sp. TaxID=165186 RepID=UPI00292F2D3A|nr:hypothetical protein [uncultured Ruminococcus sp.]